MRIFIWSYLFLFAVLGHAACPEFDTALKLSLKRIEAHKEERKVFELNKKEVVAYKDRYKNELDLGVDANRKFISLMSRSQKTVNENVVFFDVENSIQKKLNDQIFKDKGLVDAVNNSYMEKFMKNVNADSVLKDRLRGGYKDYKSLRLRLVSKNPEDKEMILLRLNDAYKKTSEEFSLEFNKLNLNSFIGPRTDETIDLKSWFLSGTGDTPVEANMAARSARGLSYKEPKRILSFNETVNSMHSDISVIEAMRSELASNKILLEAKVVEDVGDGKYIPSKDMIAILRKVKPSDFSSFAEYATKVRDKGKKIFNIEFSDKDILNFSEYFKKVDSLSPPLFSRERTIIDLNQAERGIVSVDFAGVGVDNAYSQMKALAALKYDQTVSKRDLVRSAFVKIQDEVDLVTDGINNSKKYFSGSVSKIDTGKERPLFSGDDGIFMPRKKEWVDKEKMNLVNSLSEYEDPSKFRVTFVKTNFKNGEKIETSERSKRIVRAESLEKDIREKITGASQISGQKSKEMLIAVDYSPEKVGGDFKLIVKGKNISVKEKEIIENAFQSSLDKNSNENAMEIIWGD